MSFGPCQLWVMMSIVSWNAGAFLERRVHETDNVSFNFMKRQQRLSLLEKHSSQCKHQEWFDRTIWGRRKSGRYKASWTSMALVLLASCYHHTSFVFFSLSQRMENTEPSFAEWWQFWFTETFITLHRSHLPSLNRVGVEWACSSLQGFLTFRRK